MILISYLELVFRVVFWGGGEDARDNELLINILAVVNKVGNPPDEEHFASYKLFRAADSAVQSHLVI